MWVFTWIAAALSAQTASMDVAIEVPEASSYLLSASSLAIEDGSGVAVDLEGQSQAAVSACGLGLCAPFEGLMLPLKITSTGPMKVNDRKLMGSLWVMRSETGVLIVNHLPLEEYLVATVGSEMPKTFPQEALRAQAVAARTFALQRRIARSGEVVHLRASTLDQVYGGLAHESEETRQAVQATKGEVLVFQRQPIEAFFFSSCNGSTRDPNAVFVGGDYPYMKSVPCTFCKLNKPGTWSLTLPLAALKKRIGMAVSGFSFAERLPDGRPKEVVALPSHKRFTPEALRKAIGYTALKSADFEVSCDGHACHFHGSGYGHGVGMCQWGARGMALDGKDYHDILSHYYPGAELRRLY
jgi:stage II sporulation protein D